MQKCRCCNKELEHRVIDLKKAPPSNAYVIQKNRLSPEIYFPLVVMVCEHCWLVQTLDFNESSELFDDNYSYLSSTSISWLEHSESFVSNTVKELFLEKNSFVVELASNDGYLLQFFNQQLIPNLGIEPTKSTAQIAKGKGINVLEEFFSHELSKFIVKNYKKADLIIANNVYAHVPDIIDFTNGIRELLDNDGVVSIEFPHVINLVDKNQFDTIYHEHYSYLSLTSVNSIFHRCGLKIYDVKEIDTHGGSLRVWGCKSNNCRLVNPSVPEMLNFEDKKGVKKLSYYQKLQTNAEYAKLKLLEFLINAKIKGEVTAAYGAAAKGNTLLNYCGVDSDLVSFVFDNSVEKQHKLCPGSNIPIFPLNKCKDYKIDNLIILPWNLADELKKSFQDSYLSDVNYYIAIPEVELI